MLIVLQFKFNRAAEANVRIAIEPINRYETDLIHTVEAGLGLIRKVDAGNLGLLLDGDIAACRSIEWLRRIKPG